MIIKGTRHALRRAISWVSRNRVAGAGAGACPYHDTDMQRHRTARSKQENKNKSVVTSQSPHQYTTRHSRQGSETRPGSTCEAYTEMAARTMAQQLGRVRGQCQQHNNAVPPLLTNSTPKRRRPLSIPVQLTRRHTYMILIHARARRRHGAVRPPPPPPGPAVEHLSSCVLT